jgi:hypothetical protein
MFRWTFFHDGQEIASLEYIDEPLEDDTEKNNTENYTGGATHNFERDPNPLNADGEEPWDDFGFRR